MDAATGRSLQCVVVTPERAVLDEPADSVVLPMYDGELGVLPGRAPLIGRLGFGELRTQRAGQTRRYFIDGGFAQVRSDVVTVLTPRAVKAEDINIAAATEALEATGQRAAGGEDPGARLKAQERARAQIRVARHGQGSAAGHE